MPLPLVVDLDGTLLRSDMLVETSLQQLRTSPARAVWAWLRLGQGKALLKERLCEGLVLDASTLPWDERVIELIQAARDQGRQVVLATASHRHVADAVARALPLFDDVLATGEGRNLSAHHKRQALVERFGEQGFEYLGNAVDDLPIWRSAARGWVVNGSASLVRRARAACADIRVLPPAPGRAKAWSKALRAHQWAKNLLVFAPMALAHRLGDPAAWWQAVCAFFAFSLCASSVYLANDLLDLDSDRHHPRKRLRPFASGALPLWQGGALIPLLLAGAAGLSLSAAGPAFLGVLTCYWLLSSAYSLQLKRVMALDVMVLAMLYTLRLLAGSAAVDVPLSFWLLAFSLFLFLALAMVKRHAELRAMRVAGDTGAVKGRGYEAADEPLVASLGASSGYLSVLVLALYIHDGHSNQLYTQPQWIWAACPLLMLWLTRLWLLSHRGQMHDDPMVFALTDRWSLAIGAGVLGAFWMAA